MKKSMIVLPNLALAATLFWSVPAVEAEELVMKNAVDPSAYCHMKFPPLREDTLSWAKPVFDENAGNIIDFYGPCDHDPTAVGETNRKGSSGYRDDRE